MSFPSDRRAAERFPVNVDSSCTFVSPVQEDFGPVRIKNLSQDGIGLLMSRKLEPGVLLAVTQDNPAKSLHKTVLVRVVQVTPSQGAYLVGGTFDVALKYDELSALVM